MRLSSLFFTAAFSLTAFMASSAHAYLSIAESGEILPMNKYQAGVIPQVLLNRGGGANVDAFFDMPINESTSARISLGAGAIDFSTFASVKFVPFPDIDNQPAIGVRVGLGVTRESDENWTLGQVAPLVSKKVSTDNGLFVPYAAIPFQFVSMKRENVTSAQFVVGSEWVYPETPDVRYGGEVGIEMNKSYSYVSIFVTLPFDSSKGIGR